MADCAMCGRQQADTAVVCALCAGRAAQELHQLAELAPELDVTIARLGRTGNGGGGDRDPLPVNLGASADAWAVVNTVTTWIRDIARSRGIRGLLFPRSSGPVCRTNAGVPACAHLSCLAICRSGQPVDVLAEAVRWLARQMDEVRHWPGAVQILDELGDACVVAVRIVDRQTPRWYAGPCGSVTSDGLTLCSRDLYARAGASTVTCPACGARHEARARREWLLAAAEDTLAWAELAAQALAALDLPCTRSQIAGWAHRGRLAAHAPDPAGRVLYRVGDVIALAREAAARGTERVGA